MILDFNGIPGCGKSTISKELVRYLSNLNYDVIFLQDKIVKLSKCKMLIPFMFLSEIFHGVGPVLSAYYGFYKSLPLKNRKTKHMTLAAIKNAVLAYRTIRKNRMSYIITDQCIIQNIVSCFYDQTIKDEKKVEKLLNVIDTKFKGLVLVNIDIDINIAQIRIKDRKTVGGRLDLLKGNQLHSMLLKQTDLFNIIRSVYKGKAINIDSTTSPLLNVQKIIEYINGDTKK